MAIEADLKAYLEDQADITTKVSNRVYPHQAPQGAAYPMIVYHVIDETRSYTLDGTTGMVVIRFQIDLYDQATETADPYQQVKALADEVRSALNGFKGTMGTVTVLACFLDSESDTIEITPDLEAQGVRGVRFDVLIHYQETGGVAIGDWTQDPDAISHANLSELDYASSGHTGFAATSHNHDASYAAISHSHPHGSLSDIGTNTHAQIDTHLADTTNPHSVTYTQTGGAASSHTHVEADVTDLSHDAVKLQGRTLAATAPTDGQAVAWSATNSQWEPMTISGGTTDHSTLSNLNWTAAGHTMDADLAMGGNDVTGLGGISGNSTYVSFGGQTPGHGMTSVGSIVVDQFEANGRADFDGTLYFHAGMISYAASSWQRHWTAYDSATGTYRWRIRHYNDDGIHMSFNDTDTTANNNLIFTSEANAAKDHGHNPASATATVFWHGVADPTGAGATHWLSITHDDTDGVITTGGGDLKLAPAGDVNVNTNAITNVVDPTNVQDAATKNYVDTHIADTTNPHSVTYTQTGGAASSHTHVEADVTDLDHDAAKINGKAIDDTAIADQKGLGYAAGTPGTIVWYSYALNTTLSAHTGDTTNPHSVTAAQAGAAPTSHTHVEADVTDLAHTTDHSTLSNIGTNTHAQIDTHLAATGTAVHGLGTISTQAANSISITGGSVTGITDLAIADGGTGASTASAARTALGVAVGSDVQAYDATLTSIASLGTAADKYLYTTGIDTWAEGSITAAGRAILDDADAATQRTTLGLGTMATQAANNVSITGGSVTGITDLAIADGGTGASTQQAAIDALTNVSAATNEHVLTKDTATGNAIFKAAAAGGSTPLFVPTTLNSPSSAATSEFALSNDRVRFDLSEVIPATDAVYLRAQLSTDGGSTWETTGYNNGGLAASSAGNGGYSAALASAITVSPYGATYTVGSAASEYGVSGWLEFSGLQDTGVGTRWTLHVTYRAANGYTYTFYGGGELILTTAIDRIKFYFSSGNIESGDIMKSVGQTP